MIPPDEVVVLLDVDNTLLDNDRIIDDLKRHLEHEFGAETRDGYFAILEALHEELGYADYLGALQRYRLEDMCDPRLLLMSSFLVDYPFADRLYPGSLDALEHARTWGKTVILSDGDVVFQPRKVERSGLWDAVEGRVLIYVHKERMLTDVERHYPARHYIMIDDKLRILTAMKEHWRAGSPRCSRARGTTRSTPGTSRYTPGPISPSKASAISSTTAYLPCSAPPKPTASNRRNLESDTTIS